MTSGHRLVLVYNLISFSAEELSADGIESEQQKLRDVFIQWDSEAKNDGDAPEHLSYILEHKYTDANLRLSMLKGNDYKRAHNVKEACGRANFCVFLASLERNVEMCDNDELYNSISLKRVVDMQGNVVASDADICEDDIIQEEVFEDREADDHAHEDYTGNAGPSDTYWYRNTVCFFSLSQLTHYHERNRSEPVGPV